MPASFTLAFFLVALSVALAGVGLGYHQQYPQQHTIAEMYRRLFIAYTLFFASVLASAMALCVLAVVKP